MSWRGHSPGRSELVPVWEGPDGVSMRYSSLNHLARSSNLQRSQQNGRSGASSLRLTSTVLVQVGQVKLGIIPLESQVRLPMSTATGRFGGLIFRFWIGRLGLDFLVGSCVVGFGVSLGLVAITGWLGVFAVCGGGLLVRLAQDPQCGYPGVLLVVHHFMQGIVELLLCFLIE